MCFAFFTCVNLLFRLSFSHQFVLICTDRDGIYMTCLQSGALNSVSKAQQVSWCGMVVPVSAKICIAFFFVFFLLPNVTHVFQTSECLAYLTCVCFERIAHEVPTIHWYNSTIKYPTYNSFCFLSWGTEEGNVSCMHNLNKKLNNTRYVEFTHQQMHLY